MGAPASKGARAMRGRWRPGGRAAAALAALLASASPALSACGQTAAPPAVMRVLAIGAFEGAGRGALLSARLPIDMANGRGRVLGHAVQLVERDDHGSVSQAVAAAEEACVEQDVVAVISSAPAPIATPLARVLYGCGVPLLLTAPARPASPGGAAGTFSNVFRLLGTPDEQGALIGSWMERALHPRRVYLAAEGGGAQAAGVRAGLEAAGVAVATGPLDERTAAVTHPGAIFVGQAAGAAPFLAAVRQALPGVPVVAGPELFGDSAFGSAATGQVYTASTVPQGASAGRYRTAYAAAGGGAASFDPFSCEAALLVLAAARQAGSFDQVTRASLMAGMRDPGAFEGLFGFTLDFDSSGGLGGRPLWIYRIRPGGALLLGAA